MFERFTADARRTVELAVEAAGEISHDYLGPVLLGLLRLSAISTQL